MNFSFFLAVIGLILGLLGLTPERISTVHKDAIYYTALTLILVCGVLVLGKVVAYLARVLGPIPLLDLDELTDGKKFEKPGPAEFPNWLIDLVKSQQIVLLGELGANGKLSLIPTKHFVDFAIAVNQVYLFGGSNKQVRTYRMTNLPSEQDNAECYFNLHASRSAIALAQRLRPIGEDVRA